MAGGDQTQPLGVRDNVRAGLAEEEVREGDWLGERREEEEEGWVKKRSQKVLFALERKGKARKIPRTPRRHIAAAGRL